MFGTNDDMENTNKDDDSSVVFGVRASWAANVLLLVLKLFSFYLSESQAILAALADSVVDLISQFVLASGDEIANTPHDKYPVGRARIESLSVMCSATIMIVASVEVVQVSGEAITAGLSDKDYGSDAKEWVVFMLMSVGIVVKILLQVYCQSMNRTPDGKTKSEMLDALADDHFNDIWSNTAALGCLLTAVYTDLVRVPASASAPSCFALCLSIEVFVCCLYLCSAVVGGPCWCHRDLSHHCVPLDGHYSRPNRDDGRSLCGR